HADAGLQQGRARLPGVVHRHGADSPAADCRHAARRRGRGGLSVRPRCRMDHRRHPAGRWRHDRALELLPGLLAEFRAAPGMLAARVRLASESAMNAEDAYFFRHALVREAAYSLQMPSERALLHEAAVHALRAALPDELLYAHA